MTEDPIETLSHVGVCVSDLERSLRFYTAALGFMLDHDAEIGPPFDVLAELPDLKGRAIFLKRGAVTLELLGYEQPPPVGSGERRAMNQRGLTHLAFVVRDIDAVVRRILAHGGRVLSQTRVEPPIGKLVFCTDPDGVRIELWQKTTC